VEQKAVTYVLVEDDELDMEIFLRSLKKHEINQEVRRAKDGGEAIALLREEFVGEESKEFIVFLDLNMAGVNGHEFLDEIRSDANLKSAVVFVLTSSEHERDVRLAYDKNVAGYFTKDKIDFLMQAIKPYSNAVALPRINSDD